MASIRAMRVFCALRQGKMISSDISMRIPSNHGPAVFYRSTPVFRASQARFLSVASATQASSETTPEPSRDSDTVLSALENALNAPTEVIHATTNATPYLGELAAHGIGSWTTPVGLIENLTEFATVSLGGSWIAGIVAVTLGFRILLLPVVFNGMRNNYTMANLRPKIQAIQERAKQLTESSDEKAAMAERMKLVNLFKEHNVNPFKAMLPLVTQMPIFVSFFFALRKMATTPIESMVGGGALWFQNLTLPDPYYALPVMASAFLLATVELGSDGIQQQAFMKKFFRVMSVVMLPVTAGFPAAVLVYWITSNAFSLGQLGLSRSSIIRNYYKIPALVCPPPQIEIGSIFKQVQQSDTEQKPFLDQMKDAYKSAERKSQLELMKKQNELRLEALRKTVIPKTPKQTPSPKQKDN